MTNSGSSDSMNFSPDRNKDYSSDRNLTMEESENSRNYGDFSPDRDFNNRDGNGSRDSSRSRSPFWRNSFYYRSRTRSPYRNHYNRSRYGRFYREQTSVGWNLRRSPGPMYWYNGIAFCENYRFRSRSHSRSSSSGSSSSSSSSGSSGSRSSRSSSSSSSNSSRSRERKRRQKSGSPKRRKRSPTPKPSKVHIGHLTRNVNKDHILEIFSTYGPIRNVEMMIDRLHPNFNRGFAYVEYEKSEDAEKAIKFMDGGQVDGQEVSAAAILQQRPPPRYPMRRSPPHHRRGPPPRWHEPPRFRRRSPPPRRRSPPPRRRTRSRSPARRRRYSRSSSSSSR